MTPEQRFERIETNMERLEIWLEKTLHATDARIRKLEEMQTNLMDSQNATFQAIDRLTQNVDKLIRGRGPNGHE